MQSTPPLPPTYIHTAGTWLRAARACNCKPRQLYKPLLPYADMCSPPAPMSVSFKGRILWFYNCTLFPLPPCCNTRGLCMYLEPKFLINVFLWRVCLHVCAMVQNCTDREARHCRGNSQQNGGSNCRRRGKSIAAQPSQSLWKWVEHFSPPSPPPYRRRY